MTEFETMEERHQSTSTPYEQGVVKNFTVFCETHQTDLKIDTNQSLMNTIPESLKKHVPRNSKALLTVKLNQRKTGNL